MPALLRGCPYTDEIIPFDPRGGDRLKRNLALIRELRGRRFDAAFLVNRSLHSAIVALGARIPCRVGFDTEHRGALLTRRVRYDWSKPERECILDLLRAEGIAPTAELPELWVSEDERAEASRRLSEAGIDLSRLLVGVQPGAHDPEVREWGAQRFAEALDALAGTIGAQFVLLGGKDERGVSEEVASLAHLARPVVLTGETGLREALAVISHCGLWIGNDGGLLHAAVALGPATVGIFGHTKAPRWAYCTPRHRSVTADPSGLGKDPLSIRRGLDSITPDSVVTAALSALDGKP
jgi:heptosyltransferase II